MTAGNCAFGVGKRLRRADVAFPLDTGFGVCNFKTSTANGAFPRGGHNCVFVYIAHQVSGVSTNEELFATHHPTSGIVFNDALFGVRGRMHTHHVSSGIDQGSQPRGIDGGTGRTVPTTPGKTNVTIWTVGPIDPALGTLRVDNGTSADSRTVGTGAMTFAITGAVGGSAEYYAVGAQDALGTTRILRATDVGGAWVEGPVTAYAHNVSVTIDVTATSGAGTFSAWTFSMAFGRWRGRSYKHGGLLAFDVNNIEPIYPAIAAGVFTEVPGPGGNDNSRLISLLVASDSPTAYGAMDTDAKVRAYYVLLSAALAAGRRAPRFAGCQWAWDAVDCDPAGSWLDTVGGSALTKLPGVGRPDATKLVSLPDLAAPQYSATVVHPEVDATDAWQQGATAHFEVLDEVGLARVDWLVGGSIVGTVTANPWTFDGYAVPLGTTTLTTRCLYDDGLRIERTSTLYGVATASSDSIAHAASTLSVALEADSGNVTQVAGAVSAWAGTGPDATTWVQAGATRKPTWVSSDATLGNLPTITGDGIVGADGDILTSTYNPADPVVTATWFYMIGKANSIISGAHFFATANLIFALLQDAAGSLVMRNGTSSLFVDAGFGTGSWHAAQGMFTSPDTDSYLKVGGAAVTTGFAIGAADPTATLSIFGRPTANFSALALHALVFCKGEPSASEKRAIRAYFLAKGVPYSVFV